MKTFDRDYMLTQLQNLLAIDSTSGQYREIEAYVAAEMEKMGYTPRFLRKGGVWCDLGGEGESLCLISHLDDIGLMVRHIYPDGTLKVVPVGGLRASAAESGVTEIAQKGNNLNFYLAQFEPQRVSALCGLEKYRSRLLFSAGEKPYLALRLKKGEDALKLGRKLVEDYAKTAPTSENKQ